MASGVREQEKNTFTKPLVGCYLQYHALTAAPNGGNGIVGCLSLFRIIIIIIGIYCRRVVTHIVYRKNRSFNYKTLTSQKFSNFLFRSEINCNEHSASAPNV